MFELEKTAEITFEVAFNKTDDFYQYKVREVSSERETLLSWGVWPITGRVVHTTKVRQAQELLDLI